MLKGAPNSIFWRVSLRSSASSDLGAQLTGEARQVLNNYLDKWDFEDLTNPNFEEAVKREDARDVWRTSSSKLSTWTLKMVNILGAEAPPIRLNLEE